MKSTAHKLPLSACVTLKSSNVWLINKTNKTLSNQVWQGCSTRNLSRDENTRTWLDVYRFICLLTLIHRYPLNRTSPIRHKMDHTQVNYRHLNLKLTSRNIYNVTAPMCGLRIVAAPPITVIFATVGLVYNLQPEYELAIARLVSDNSRSLKKSSWGTVLPIHPLKKTFFHGIYRVLFHSYPRVRFDLLS